MLRVVFDTVVFVRSLINPHRYCGRIVFEYFAKYRLFLSRPILEEILDVLSRDELTVKFSALKDFDLARVLDIVSQAEVVDPAAIHRGSRDPGDDKFLAAARAAEAGYLVSEDLDLLVLAQSDHARIVRCEEFLAVLARND